MKLWSAWPDFASGECFLLCQGAVQATLYVFDSTLECGDVKPASTLKLQKFVGDVERGHDGQPFAGGIGLGGEVAHFFVEVGDGGEQAFALFRLAADPVFAAEQLDVEGFHVRGSPAAP